MPKPSDIAKALTRYDELASMSMVDPLDYSGKYNTPLNPAEAAAYQKWLATLPDYQRNTRDYDMQGAFKAGLGKSANGHFPDTFKKPNHPTFSTESQYSGVEGNMGGTWSPLPGGKWAFAPAASGIKKPLWDEAALREYFARNEPDATLNYPKGMP